MSSFRKIPNVVNLATNREINDDICYVLQKKLHVTDKFIDRLGLEIDLEGHDGCVNCLQWNDTGSLLASGSDDTHVIIWDPFHKKKLTTLPTFHNGNIFSVKFMPHTNDTKIVTGAADCKISGIDVVTKDTVYVCNCARSRIKRIAVAPDVPDLFWSASEDGIIRQADIRIHHTCDEDAKNVIINLKNHQGALAEGKCITVNPVRTEMLAVGSNDPYIRLYDRRMIKVTTNRKSGQWYQKIVEDESSDSCSESELKEAWRITDNVISGCVQYFVPGHLQIKSGCKKAEHNAVTYLSFSPDGKDLLANLGSEQVYLFDVTRKHPAKYFTIPSVPIIKEYEAVNDSIHENNGMITDTCLNDDKTNDILPNVIEDIKLAANEHFKNGEYLKAIRMYNDAIRKYKTSAVLFGNRAAAYMKRAWKGDMYAALRDCSTALKLDPDYMKAFFRLARCFHELKRFEEAKTCLDMFKSKFMNHADSHACRALEKDIEDACKKHTVEKNRKSSRRLQVSKPEKVWRKKASDYEHRYCGHCNSTTDIKEANFFGNDGRFIVAGSDDGSIFFWDRFTENNIRILKGDSSIVNCLQPHPYYCLLASSGIEPVVRIWTPKPEDGKVNEKVVRDLDLAAEKNHKRMKKDDLDVMFISNSGSSSEESSQLECRAS
ncbi:WD and tetratricopeptide repeats protein 1 isoform X2 [Planococcus citri]|uniref:WD and tetratricopeptide repeats protein 1 isoform X2 n=1 Tax=Planococcus citri TaxID=170843 RepID=UPI0031F9BAA5